MRYQLYSTGHNDTSQLLREVFVNRGIDDYVKYTNLDDTVVQPYTNLDNISSAVELYLKHRGDKINILVDSDPDGYCSAAMMYKYIKADNENAEVNYILHERSKAHGLSDVMDKIGECDLLIIPDASTNDVNECKALKDRNVDILILDHHESEVENPYAVIVNNQMSNNYTNKDFCGAGIVYRYLQALDEELWNEYADDYLDLVALANISDMMDLRSCETRYLVDKGLHNIKNKGFDGFIRSQQYSMKDKVNIHNVQWSITPLMNALIRCGSSEDRELMFRSFIETDETFEYNKRATKNYPAMTIIEPIYDRVPRLCKNTKTRQDKEREKAAQQIIEIADNSNKVIIEDVSTIMDAGLTGVVAAKIARHFNKPCILLRIYLNEDGTITYGGSARNVSNSPIESFKDIINQTTTLSGAGHGNAFGIVGLKAEDKEKAISELNTLLKDVEYDSSYNVDFILPTDDITVPFVYQISQLEDYLCQGIPPVAVAIENIVLSRDEFSIIGKNEDTITFVINDVKFIKFRCDDNDPLMQFVRSESNEQICITVVGEPSMNEYQNVKTAQVIINDVDIIGTKDEVDSDEEIWQ